MTTKRPRHLPVTDHAVLRWLERFAHVDIEAVREQIFRETHHALNSGASKITVNGTEYRIRDGHVVTIIAKHRPRSRLKWSPHK